MLFYKQIIFILLLCLTQYLVECKVNLVEVITSSGTVKGQTLNVLNKQINQYLNIPYAEPPVGKLRFAPPVPLKQPKKDVIDGTKSGNYCIQYTEFFERLTQSKITQLSEDCLVLNIWTPIVNNDHGHLKPVMFFIPGGANTMGSIFQDLYNSSVLATNDVVVASVNSRVGPLGFLYGGDETAPGNVALYDQLLGLKWVRDNIHMFGGNKNEITIFGTSSGSWSVSAHILSPLSKGLFRRAIMQSGSVMYNKDRPPISAGEGLANAKQLAQQLGCNSTDIKWLDCMRAIDDPKRFILKPEASDMFIMVQPTFGTQFLPLLPQKAFETGLYNSDVELMAGAIKDEGPLISQSVYPEMKTNLTETQFWILVNKLRAEYHNIDVKKVGNFYLKTFSNNRTDPGQLKKVFSKLFGDLLMICPTYLFAKRMAMNGQSVYYFRFNYQSSIFLHMYGDVCAGDTVCHGADVAYMFGLPLLNQQVFTQIDYNFSVNIMKIWTDFAKTGKPHNVWPKLLDPLDSKRVLKVNDMNPMEFPWSFDMPLVNQQIWTDFAETDKPHNVWPKLLNPSDMNGVSKVKDLNPNDMSLVLDNPFGMTCDGIWSDYY